MAISTKWSKGGMQCNGLRQSTEVRNYFTTPGRMNLIPHADVGGPFGGVSSIGYVHHNGLKQVAAGTSGPGTLMSTNLQVVIPMIPNDMNMGHVMQNDKRSQFVDYRQTDPMLVENLRKNPLSIYAVGDAKTADIPAFFSFIQPENYNTYTTSDVLNISNRTTEAVINGSPQASILDLASQNPMMGITTGIPNSKATFNGKTYGGNDSGSARKYADEIYNQNWQPSSFEPVSAPTDYGDRCINKALLHFAPGYNIAEQVKDNRFIAYVGPGDSAVTNLPYGPIRVTGDPRTQQGGIWQQNGPFPTRGVATGYTNNPLAGSTSRQPAALPPRKANEYNYVSGLPGSLVI